MKGGLEYIHHFPQDYNTSGTLSPDTLRTAVRTFARDGGNMIWMEVCKPRAGKVNGCSSSWGWEDIKVWVKDVRGVETRYTSLKQILDLYRVSDYEHLTIDKCFEAGGAANRDCFTSVVFSQYGFIAFWSCLNMFKTMMVILVLAFTTVLFSFDAQRFVIGPIKRMTDMVRQLGDNPLAAIKNRSLEDKDKQALETGKLEEVLNKIGKLLQKSFGAAGADIIGQNMGKGELNALMPGTYALACPYHCTYGSSRFNSSPDCSPC
jgi:hypothetical protein